MQKIIEEDTREKPSLVGKINRQFEENGYKVIRTKLYVGDYRLLDNPYYVVDRKQNLAELCSNATVDHQRFKRELQKALDAGIHITFLCEHGGKITCLEDIKNWYNPRLKDNPKAVTGEKLYKILDTIRWRYQCDFTFCRKSETGLKIMELLEIANSKTKNEKKE